MVPLPDLIMANLFQIITMGVSIVFIFIMFMMYSNTQHKGYLLVIIGEIVTLGWSVFSVFVLQGVYLYAYLDTMGLQIAEINFISFVISLVGLGFHVASVALMIVGLVMFSSDLQYQGQKVQY